MTYSQKRFDEIQAEITTQEVIVAELQKKYESDYSKEIESELELAQNHLDQLFEEWSALDEARNALT